MGAGRPKAFKSPKELLSYFIKYKAHNKDNPRKETIFHQKTGKAVVIDKQRPLTWQGFEKYLNKHGVIANLSNYKANSRNQYSEYSIVLRACTIDIEEDQLSGAIVGTWQHNIVARINGLVDKQEMVIEPKVLTLEEKQNRIKELMEAADDETKEIIKLKSI